MKTNWSAEDRLRQAEIIRARSPWKRSTGPKTPTGKAKVAQNPVKHGLRGGIYRQAADLLARHNKILKELAE